MAVTRQSENSIYEKGQQCSAMMCPFAWMSVDRAEVVAIFPEGNVDFLGAFF